MKPLEAIRCTLPSCPCECFSPAKGCLRMCDSCKHGWVAHAIQTDGYALDKLGYRHVFNVGLQVEIVQPNIVFDIASLMLYGAQATPIRLKILLDRLFSVLQHEEVLQVLHGFGWSYEDYARGYILQYEDEPEVTVIDDDQETSGRVLGKWTCATREEEYIIIQQFLRFGETKSIAQEIILQDTQERQDLYIKQTSRNESEIKKFIERSNVSMQNLIRPFDVRHLFGARMPFLAAGSRLLNPPVPGFPVSTPSSSPRGELRPPLISVTSTSPITTSPLGRLQTMQPFDYRRESASPAALSPGDRPQQTTRENSPKSESPQNLSLTSTSAHSTPPHTPYTPQKMMDMENRIPHHLPMIPTSMTMGSATMVLPTLQRPSNHEDGAINFSIKEDHQEMNKSMFSERKMKHFRKSNNPIKRNWLPEVNFGTTMIGPNGKKRVLCSACNKSFCDKGALKIHYSAVHLKEMHKCSVEGCTMMFSSRRSRNRHAANPNPKLHMPQKRPKMQEGEMHESGSHKRSLSSPSMVLSPSMATHSQLSMMESPDQRPYYPDHGMHLPMFPSAAKRLKLDSDDETPRDLSLAVGKSEFGSSNRNPRNMSLHLMPDIDGENDDIDVDTPSRDSHDGDFSENEKHDTSSSNNSPCPQRTHSRRKNIPTRCAPSVDRFRLGDGESAINVDNDQRINLGTKTTQEQNGDSERSDIKIEDGVKSEQEGRSVKLEDGQGEDYAMDRSDDKLVIDDVDDDDDDDDIDRNDTGEILDFTMNAMDTSECENMSGQDSNGSFASNESELSKTNGDLASLDFEIPIDKENPKQCLTCGKQFLNLFGLKIHYKNVHLKLMHKCKVEGCSAEFPSKRSRDRHSSNLNLHRKLLSTSDDQKITDETDDNQNFRADVIQKLYDIQAFNDNDQENVNKSINNGHSKHDTDKDTENGKNESDIIDESDVDKTNGFEDGVELGDVVSEGMVSCHICDMKVKDNLVLKEHFELNHPKEMFHCTISGCGKIFSTRKSRNRHSQNESLHKDLSPMSRTITA